jgi:hypothetical protein
MIGSSAGSIETGAAFSLPFGSYGMSKAAENYLARKLHFEHESEGLSASLALSTKEGFSIFTSILVVFPICPGPVLTEGGM